MRTKQAHHRYDRDAVVAQLNSATSQWSLFGGEALLLHITHLEELLKLGFEKWGSTGIQTNGTLISDRHIELFTKYKTHVGISLDGPDALNDSRWAGTLEATRKATAKTLQAIDTLLIYSKEHAFLSPSIILTLHAGNAAKDKWPILKAWLHELDAKGLQYLNVHVMEMDAQASEWFLPHDELMGVLQDLWETSTTFTNIKVANFKEIIDLLRGNDSAAMCVWHACDPWNTAAVQGLENDGSPSHCSRTNKDGIDWLPAEGQGVKAKQQIGEFEGQRFHERQLSLYVTPQEDGGCKDCRFWMMCQGQCPGTGDQTTEEESGDWRLRSSYCETWKSLFTEGEKRLRQLNEVPLSLHPNRLEMEAIMYGAWKQGKECAMSTAIKIQHKELTVDAIQNPPGHGDHWDDVNLLHDNKQINRPHGDNHTNIGIPKPCQLHHDGIGKCQCGYESKS